MTPTGSGGWASTRPSICLRGRTCSGPFRSTRWTAPGWEHKAGQVAAYREMWGWTHPAEPISPRPGPHSPEASRVLAGCR